MRRRPEMRFSGGQGVHREVESEGHEEKYGVLEEFAQAAHAAMAAMEAPFHASAETDPRGSRSAAGMAVSQEWARPLVERWGLAHARTTPQSWFERMGLLSLLATERRFSLAS